MTRNDEQQPTSRLLPWTMAMFGLAMLATVLADYWMHVDYRLAANIALMLAAVGVTAFTLLYGLRSRWRANRIGRIYLIKCMIFSITLGQIVLASWWDSEYPYRQQIRFLIYTFAALVYIPMVISLWREQQRDRRRPDSPCPPSVPTASDT